jgi:hypothetical protein
MKFRSNITGHIYSLEDFVLTYMVDFNHEGKVVITPVYQNRYHGAGAQIPTVTFTEV